MQILGISPAPCPIYKIRDTPVHIMRDKQTVTGCLETNRQTDTRTDATENIITPHSTRDTQHR